MDTRSQGPGSPAQLQPAATPECSPTAIVEAIAATMGDTPHALWPARLAKLARDCRLNLSQTRSVATDLAWIARRRGEPVTELLVDGPPERRLISLYVTGQRLRFDFKFSELRSVAKSWPSRDPEDALVTSFLAFSALGTRSPDGTELLHRALNLPDADRRTRFVCLAGIWSAHHLSDQGQRLVELCDQILTMREGDGNVYFRRAAGYRKLGRFTEVLDDIDRAIEMLPPGNNDVNQDYIRERELIGLAMSFWHQREPSIAHEERCPLR